MSYSRKISLLYYRNGLRRNRFSNAANNESTYDLHENTWTLPKVSEINFNFAPTKRNRFRAYSYEFVAIRTLRVNYNVVVIASQKPLRIVPLPWIPRSLRSASDRRVRNSTLPSLSLIRKKYIALSIMWLWTLWRHKFCGWLAKYCTIRNCLTPHTQWLGRKLFSISQRPDNTGSYYFRTIKPTLFF